MDLGFVLEMEQTSSKVRDAILAALEFADVSAEVREYVKGCRLYFRAPYLLTSWQHAREMRERLAVDMGMHIMSLKLGDDLVDNDMSTDRLSLGVGSLHLSHLALHRMCGYLDPEALLALLTDSMAALCRSQILATQNPAINMAQWREHADGYGGGFLRIYAKIATLAGEARLSTDAACCFATGFGNLITLADDLRDYTRTGEQAGNLGALILEGRVSVEEVMAFVKEMRDVAFSGCTARPTVYDLRPAVDFFANDVLSRMIPELQGQRLAGQDVDGSGQVAHHS